MIQIVAQRKSREFHPQSVRGRWSGKPPLFLILRNVPNKNNSSKVFRAHMLSSMKCPIDAHWVLEIAERYIRIFKPLAADSQKLKIKLRDRYGVQYRWLRIPEPGECIGYLTAKKNYAISATGYRFIHDETAIGYAARERDEKLNKPSFLKKELSAKEREFFILRTELKAYLTARNRYDKLQQH